LPLVEPPPLPDVNNTQGKSVEIDSITIDDLGHYVVEYTIQGFEEKLPGTHMHFFFNTVPLDQVGLNGIGSRLMFGGPAPFLGYKTVDRPQGATEMCVLVANPDHSVIPGSGNCFALPEK